MTLICVIWKFNWSKTKFFAQEQDKQFDVSTAGDEKWKTSNKMI